MDAVLPVLDIIGIDLKAQHENDAQQLVPIVFLGLAFGQMLFGVISDSKGRKLVVYLGLALYVIGTLVAISSMELTTMLIGRFIQGLGLGGPRIATVAMIRDKYAGDAMGKVMSFVMMIFIFIPAVSPAIGLSIANWGSWKSIFYAFLIFAGILLIWFHFRQNETLQPQNKNAISLKALFHALKDVFKSRIAMFYSIGSGFVSGVFIAYLSSSKQIFSEVYDKGNDYPFYFAMLAIALGFASFVNGRLVMKMGMKFMAKWSSYGLFFWSVIFTIVTYQSDYILSFNMFMIFLSVALFLVGILFGNLKSLSMEPLGHIAGVGAAIVSLLATLLAVPLSNYIGQSYDRSIFPLILGFVVCSFFASVSMLWARK